MSWLATATNADTFPIRSPSSDGERVQVGIGERAERHRQDVQLAGLDQRQQQRQRAVEGRQRHPRRGLRTPAIPERDRRLGHGRCGQRHQQASSAAWNRAPYSGSTGRGLVADEVHGPGRQPGGREGIGGGPGMIAETSQRIAPARHAGGGGGHPRPERLAERPRDPRPGARCRPSRSRGAGRRPGRRGPARRRAAGASRRPARDGGRRRAWHRTGRARWGGSRRPASGAPRGSRGRGGASGAGGPYAPTRRPATP